MTMPVLWVATGCLRSRRLPLRAESVLVLPTKDAMLYCGERNFEVLGFYIASTILTDPYSDAGLAATVSAVRT